ncbi:PTS system mannose/fructose/sorbose family transporter subunit IID [Sporolactobacillus sp. KGMB 08714]|uniref:PTS system mannose/fructose/sorbose family transporter subunit IID n=1 Tax=Sporolactobacillus sp. KGMB 08714 TaxID=3064704 RepID=UPI002FBDE0F6
MDGQGQQIKLTKKDVAKSFWRWTFFSHSNYNYERMQSTGFTHAMIPVLTKLYGNDKEKLSKSLQRHLEFFNTEPHFGGVIGGISIAMEEQKANGAPISGQMISSVKTGLMGPLAGVGDTLWQGTIVPILLSFAISIGSKGNLLGPGLYIVAMFCIMWTIAYQLWMRGYYLGKEGIMKILAGNMLKRVLTLSQILGGIVIGGLTATFVKLSTPLKIHAGTATISVQQGVLDVLFKGMLPFAMTLLVLFLLNKKLKSTYVLLIIVLIAGIGAGFWIF